MPNRRLYTEAQVPTMDAGWWNADGTATIYLTTDASQNQATLTLTNRTGDAVTLPAGSAAAYGSAPAGQGTLYLYFNGLLSNDEVDRITVGAAGWTQRAYVDETTGLAYLALSSSSPVSLAVGETLTLPMNGATATGSARAGNLTLSLSGMETLAPAQATLSIYVAVVAAPQAGNRKLDLLVGFAGPDFVFTGGQENELVLVLTNPANEPLVPGGAAAWEGDPPTFTFSFVFTASADDAAPGALTDAGAADSISIELGQTYGNDWDAVEKDDQGQVPTWSAQPSENQGGTVLGTGANASVSFRISGITVSQPAGATYLYVSYANVPGYDDGYFAVEIVKVMPITADLWVYPSNVTNVSSAQEVQLQYVVEYATFATITNTSFAQAITEPVVQGTVYTTAAATTTYTLLASNQFTGQTVAATGTVTIGPDMYGLLPYGTIVMWHGDINHPPPGWSICDGNNNTPNLLNRFIMGTTTSGSTIGVQGGASSHTHALTVDVAIGNAGAHKHGVPSNWYGNTASSGNRVTVVDRDAKSVSDAKTQTAGDHTHPVTVTKSLGTASNLPPYCALAFIMKTS